tara:strand:+ start:41 stop:859 length:819 start_codon:yes stop_codon:yes gene_type:complete
MPELPEVETTVRGLKVINSKKIVNVKIHIKKLRFNIPKKIEKKLINSKISNIRRIAKYIILDLDNNLSLVIHLGMSGRLKIANDDYKRIKHDHFIIFLNNQKLLIYNDPRRFGFLDLSLTPNLKDKKYISRLGLDALSTRLTYKYLFERISKSHVPIKQILLNQEIISGIGNIYASEILFDAKISPFVLGKDINITHLVKLIKSIRKILRKAIRSGGSSIRDYRNVSGVLGNFQSSFKVYGKEGKIIGKNKILKIVQYGRSTFYCPKLQNNK